MPMRKLVFVLFLMSGVINLRAQYIYYSDTRNIHASDGHEVKKTDTITRVIIDTVKVPVRDTVRVIVRDTIKTPVHDTITLRVRDTIRTPIRDTITLHVRDTVEIVVHDTVNVNSDEVYHKWPDRCPGFSASTPVLRNYIPPKIVLKLTEIFKGYLYSITRTILAGNKVQYELKVCDHGVVKIKYADESGVLIEDGAK